MANRIRNLEGKLERASHTKTTFDMAPSESLELRELLLKITNYSIAAFDALDAGEISETDLLKMVLISEYVNKFNESMKKYALTKMDAEARARVVRR